MLQYEKCLAGTYSFACASICNKYIARTFSKEGAYICNSCLQGTYSIMGQVISLNVQKENIL